jgi:hypothetical protein
MMVIRFDGGANRTINKETTMLNTSEKNHQAQDWAAEPGRRAGQRFEGLPG